MSIKTTKAEGYIVPLGNNTKLRKSYSTYSDTVNTYNAGVRVDVIEIIERLESDPQKVHDYKGDKWAKVVGSNGNVLGYMAIMYHTSTFAPYRICNEFYRTVGESEIPPVETNTRFPDFILVSGNIDGNLVEKRYIPEA